MGEARGSYGGEEKSIRCVWKPVGKRRLDRPRRRWEDDIKVGVKETW